MVLLLLLAAGAAALFQLGGRDRSSAHSPPAPAASPGGPALPPERPAGRPRAAGGVLVLRDGRPAAAEVWTAAGAGARGWRSLGRSGEDGRIPRGEFENPPEAVVFALAPGVAAAPVEWREEGVVLELDEGCVLQGRVLDSKGRPVAGAWLLQNPTALLATSDSEGRFRITGLRPGPSEVEVLAPPGRGRQEIRAEFTAWGETIERDVTIEAAPPGGVVLEVEWGAPSAGPALLVVVSAGRTTRLSLPADVTTLPLEAIDPGAAADVALHAAGFATARASVAGPPPGETARVTLRLEPGAQPTGRAIHADGRPAARAWIVGCATPSLDASPRWETWADGEGRFHIESRALGLHLLARIPGEAASGWRRLDEFGEEVVLTLAPGGAVTGRVVDPESGAPHAGAAVRLSFGADAWRAARGWSTKTDGAGWYRFGGLPVGTFVRPFVAEDGPLSTALRHGPSRRSATVLLAAGAAGVVEKAGQELRIDLHATRRPGGAIRVVARPPAEGEDEEVRWEYEGPGISVEASGELHDGAAVFERYLPLGAHAFFVWIGRYYGSLRLEATSDGDHGEVEIELKAGPRVVVQLVDDEGRPLESAPLEVGFRIVEPPGEVLRESFGRTDRGGRVDVTMVLSFPTRLGEPSHEVWFTVDELPYQEGVDRVDASLILSIADLAERMRAAGEELVLAVPPRRPRPVTIRVAGPDESPLAGVSLRLDGAIFDRESVSSGPDGTVVVSTTRSAGRASAAIGVEAPHVLLQAEADGGEIRLRVAKSRRVRVRVVNSEGTPVPAVVAGIPIDGDEELSIPENLEALDVDVADHYVPSPLRIEPGQETAELVVLPLRPVRVRAEAPPALRLSSELWLDFHPAEKSGRARRRALPREATGYAGVLWLPDLPGRLVAGSPDPAWGDAAADVAPGAREVGLRFEPISLHPVVLLLTDDAGRPVANERFRLGTFENWRDFVPPELRSDAGGRIVLELPAGKYGGPANLLGAAGAATIDEFRVPAAAPIPLRLQRR